MFKRFLSPITAIVLVCTAFAVLFIFSSSVTAQDIPEIEVVWEEDFGYPDFIDWNIAFPPEIVIGGWDGHPGVEAGEAYDIIVTINNNGNANLLIENIRSNHDYFTSNFEDEFEIEPDESREIILTFEAPRDEEGEYEAVMAIESNDPENENVEIELFAVAFEPGPTLRIRFPEIDDFIFSGDIEEYTLNLSNLGEDSLRFSIEFEIVVEPEEEIAEIEWLVIEPAGGNIPPGEDVDISITIDATGLPGGDYEAEIHILTNDPNDGVYVFNLIIHVEALPQIFVEWAEEAGFNPENPDGSFIDWNGMYRDFFMGAPYEVPITIHNEGMDDLIIEDIQFNNELFSSDFEDELELGIYESVEITLVFEAPDDEAGEFEGIMTIISNDPRRHRVEIPLFAESFLPPHIEIEPDFIEADMSTGEIEDFPITISNSGGAVLRFVVESEIIAEPDRDNLNRNIRSTAGPMNPRRDDAGDLLGQFQGINQAASYCNPAGWDWDNDRMWVTSYSQQIAVAYTHDDAYEEFEEVIRIQPGACMDGAWINGLYFTSTYGNNQVQRFDEDGENIGNVQLEHELIGFAADVEEGWLFVMTTEDQNPIHVFEVDDEGGIGDENGLISFHHQYQNYLPVYNFEWVHDHPEGQLWINAANNQSTHQIFVDIDEWECIEQVNSFNVGVNQPHDAVAHDGDNLWVGGRSAANIRIYEDGIDEVRWLSFDPAEGEIEEDEEMELLVTLDATGLWGGDYEADLHIYSNDPENDDLVVEIMMDIRVHFVNMVTWPEAAGYPDEVNWNWYFEDLFTDQEYSIPVEIYNGGVDGLIIESIESDNEAFRSSQQEFEIEPGETAEAEFIFQAEEAGEYEGAMTIFSDDPDEGEFEIALTALAMEPPEIHIEPDRIVDRLYEGVSEEYTLTVSNVGGSDLRFDCEFEFNDGRRDENEGRGRNIRSTAGPMNPGRDDAGDLLGQFQGINQAASYCNPAGWDWDNDRMWVTSYSQQIAVAYTHDNDYEEFEEVIRINPGNCLDGAWINGLYFTSTFGNRLVQRYDEDGENVGSVEFDHNAIAFAADVEEGWLFVMAYENQNPIHVFEVDDDGVIGDEIGLIDNHLQFHNNQAVWNMEWVSCHPEGQLWMVTNSDGFVNQIFVDEDWEAQERVSRFAVNGNAQLQAHDGVAHDGENMWCAGWGPGNIRIYDDGVDEFPIFEWEPREGNIEPDEEMDIVVTVETEGLDIGWYEGLLVINSNDPETPVIEVPIRIQIEIFDFPWDNPTNYVHIITVEELTFNDEDVPYGWWIMVFTPDGVLGGGAVWLGRATEISVYGAEGEIDGFRGGEEFNFILWDPEEDEEYETVEVEFLEGDEVWHNEGESRIRLAGYNLQELVLDLREGWNLISINVDPYGMYDEDGGFGGPDVELMFAELAEREQIILMKDNQGRFWMPEWGYNNIPYWDLTEGYWVKMTEAIEYYIEGEPIDAQSDIVLTDGWNTIAYFPLYELEASRESEFYVLSPIIDHVIIAKDVIGRFMQLEFNYSNMIPWRLGQGYQVKVDCDDDITLNYPEQQEERLARNFVPRNDNHLRPQSNTNMSVLINSVSGLEAESDLRIQAFNSDGLEVGFGTIDEKGQCGLAIWGDDESTDIVEGLCEGEAFELRMVSESSETPLSLQTIMAGNGLVYTTNDFTVLEMSAASAIPEDYFLSQNYPNPFNSITRLNYGLPEAGLVNISVFDIEGRLVETLVSSNQVAGYHYVTWDANIVSSGLYFIEMNAIGFTQVQKIVLTK